jgi:hypothetical protein
VAAQKNRPALQAFGNQKEFASQPIGRRRDQLHLANKSVKLEDLQPGASVRGILPDALVSVVNVQWHGADALTLVYRGLDGRVADEIL